MNSLPVSKEKTESHAYSLGWNGFSPRWQFPSKLVSAEDPTLKTSTLLMVLDSAREVTIGIGPNFSKTKLDRNEIMVSSSALRFLKTAVGSKVDVTISFDPPSLRSIHRYSTLDPRNFIQDLHTFEAGQIHRINTFLSQYFENRSTFLHFLQRTFELNITRVDGADHIIFSPEQVAALIKNDRIRQIIENSNELRRLLNFLNEDLE
mmetsp:Transcript_2326/g.3977  ORF Transcript_2326/g.3977 Transcript_2326/m.3977 type:complete len:206 (+) Transcript_2326:931-1548(+)